ncbi:MAG: SEC-C domain-containing protein [Gammaproteobacteria bacterium]
MNDMPPFTETGYSLVRELVPRTTARLCTAYAAANRDLPDYYAPESAFNAWGRYADSIGEALLAQSRPAIEEVTGLALFPAYSFLRIYCEGAILPRHTDRPSCEISVTLTLGGDALAAWPIWLEAQGETRAVTLPPGDALVYRGALLPHWRERFDGRFWVQLFLHYVCRDGTFADCRFDGRERLGPIVPGQDPRRRNLHRSFAADDPCPCGSGLRYGACHGRVTDG